MFKKILITTLTILIAASGFLTGFFSVGVICVYASVNDNTVYVPLRDPSDAVISFQAYCKSRDLTIEGSLTDAVTTFTTGAFNSACNEVGINISELQAEIKAEYDSLGKPVKFFFNDTGVMAMNRIFSQFLQDNELSVGDEDVNKVAYSGTIVTDNNNVNCLVTIIRGSVVSLPTTSNVLAYGNTYLMDGLQCRNYALTNGSPATLPTGFYNKGTTNIFNYTITTNWLRNDPRYSNYTVISQVANYLPYNAVYEISRNSGNRLNGAGYLSVLYFQGSNTYCLGSVFHDYIENKNYVYSLGAIDVNNDRNAQINLTSVVINNNNYEGDTYITNEGDIINNPQPQQPNDPNDTIHNVPETPLSPNGDGGWDIDLPDIDIPNLPIGNLSEKFPFSIPWDLVAFYAMLDAEPEAPRFNGTMDLTLVQWNYDIDLSPFDSAAELCRKLQFGLFVVGLIVASRSIIRG